MTIGFGGRMNPLWSVSTGVKRVMVVRRVDLFGVIAPSLLSGRLSLPVCAYQLNVLPLCFHFAQFDCQLLLPLICRLKTPNFFLFPFLSLLF